MTLLVPALAVPALVSMAWIPVRDTLPNIDLALILVVVVGATGFLGRRSPVVVASLSAAIWFEFFDTVPYERLTIARQPDVETTLVLAIVACAAGELTLRISRHRSFLRDAADKMRIIRWASALLATGEELVRLVDEVCSELSRFLALEHCYFEALSHDPARVLVERDGRLIVPAGGARTSANGRIIAEVAVWGQGDRIGHFVLIFGPVLPPSDRLAVAVTLADQVGAAFSAQVPPPDLPASRRSAPTTGLRAVR